MSASPRGARPKDTQPTGRWASYPGVHRPHGLLSDRCLAKRPAPDQGSAGEDRRRVRGGGTPGQRPTHKSPGRGALGAAMMSRLSPAPGPQCFLSLGLRVCNPDVHANAERTYGLESAQAQSVQ